MSNLNLPCYNNFMKIQKHSPILIFVCAAIIFTILATVFVPSYDSSESNGTTSAYNDGWLRVYDDGTTVPFTDFGKEIPDGRLVLIHEMNDTAGLPQAIGFYNYYSAVYVYVNNIPIYQYGSKEDLKNGVMLGNYYSMVDVHLTNYSENTLRVVFYGNDPILTYGFDAGSGSALEMSMIREYITTLLLPIIALIFLAVILIIKRRKETRDLIGRVHFWLILFIFNLAIWMLADSQILMDIGLRAGTVCLLSFEVYMLLPISLMMFTYYACRKSAKVNIWICGLTMLNIVVLNILNFTGICSFRQSLYSTHILTATGLIIAWVEIIQEFNSRRNRKNLQLLIGFSVCGVSGLIQFILFLINPAATNSRVLQIGSLVFAVLQISSVLREINDRMYQVNVRLETRNKMLQQTFGSFIPTETMQSIVDSPENFHISGSTRELTVLQSDIRGFSELIQEMCAAKAIDMLNHYLEAMTIIIQRHGGTIIEFVGDGIIAVFDKQTVGEQHANKAVFAAVEMQNCMEDVNQWNLENGCPEFEMGIGINTGSAYVGYIGSKTRIKYDAIGNTINLVSRIESYSTGGQILLSESCKSACTLNLMIIDQHRILPKGFYAEEVLYLLGGIGEPYNIVCRNMADTPVLLDVPVYTEFITVENKHCGNRVYTGYINAQSETSAILQTDCPLMLFDNIRITAPFFQSCKVISKSRNGFLIRFTSVTHKGGAEPLIADNLKGGEINE